MKEWNGRKSWIQKRAKCSDRPLGSQASCQGRVNWQVAVLDDTRVPLPWRVVEFDAIRCPFFSFFSFSPSPLRELLHHEFRDIMLWEDGTGQRSSHGPGYWTLTGHLEDLRSTKMGHNNSVLPDKFSCSPVPGLLL